MKRIFLTMVFAVMSTLGMMAMSYEQAREHALYLTDKMAYELDLNEEQYEYAYEINLDYLMGIRTELDIEGTYLVYRNNDFRHILYDWQWNMFCTVDYFLRPVSWRYGCWYFPVYGHYHRSHYYFARPVCYATYRGGHNRYYYSSGYYAQRRPYWSSGMNRGQRNYDRSGHSQFRGNNEGGNRGGNNYGNRGGSEGGNRGGSNYGNRGGSSENHGSSRPYTRNNEGNRNSSIYSNSRSSSSISGSSRGSSYTPSTRVSTPSYGGVSRGSSSFSGSSRGSSSFSGSSRGSSSFSGSSRGSSSFSGSSRGGSMGGSSRGGASFSGSSRGGSMGGGQHGGSMGGGRGR